MVAQIQGAAMNQDLMRRMGIGCIGALTPILVNILIVDLQTQLSNTSVISALFYALRVVALCAAACIVIYLNDDESRPVKLFQLGVAAPALLTGMINGAVIANQKPAQQQTSAGAVVTGMLHEPMSAPGFTFSFVGEARAQTAGANTKVLDCRQPKEPTFGQQALKGFLGIQPDNEWFVVVGSNPTAESASGDADVINRKYSGKFSAKVCAPLGGADNRYRVVVGEYLSYDDATRMRVQAVAAGLPADAWVWNPMLPNK